MVVLRAAEQPRDEFINTALSAATAVLKPQWAPIVENGAADWAPAWRNLIVSLDRKRPVAPKASPAPQKTGVPIVPIYGRLRASAYTTGAIAAEVLTRGDPKHGADVFRRPELACLSCHRVGSEGGQIGPALDAIGSAQPLELIIGMIIEPQREIKEGFEAIKLTTRNGGVVIGIVVAGNASELTLRDPEGVEHTVAQAEIVSREMIGSLMPAGLTDSLTPEDFRDLLAYLGQLGKAK